MTRRLVCFPAVVMETGAVPLPWVRRASLGVSVGQPVPLRCRGLLGGTGSRTPRQVSGLGPRALVVLLPPLPLWPVYTSVPCCVRASVSPSASPSTLLLLTSSASLQIWSQEVREVRTHPSYPHQSAAASGAGQGDTEGLAGVVGEAGLVVLPAEPMLRSSAGHRRDSVEASRLEQASVHGGESGGSAVHGVHPPTPEGNGQPATEGFWDAVRALQTPGLAESSWGQSCGLRRGSRGAGGDRREA
uniref:uncharacterized protein LOC118540768 n=1 Tax=Halichoerus grypus TaxID=9711 RepID=UPI001658F0C2|nr:uncharacterized protein LOC118540768 [Halichoerus grypus]